MRLSFVVFFTFLSIPVLAVEPSAGAGFLDKIVEFLPSELPAWAGVLIAFIFELLLRIWPTAKPKSLLLVVLNILKAIEKIFEKLVLLLDGILQNVKDSHKLQTEGGGKTPPSL
jgi:hypothetical protein